MAAAEDTAAEENAAAPSAADQDAVAEVKCADALQLRLAMAEGASAAADQQLQAAVNNDDLRPFGDELLGAAGHLRPSQAGELARALHGLNYDSVAELQGLPRVDFDSLVMARPEIQQLPPALQAALGRVHRAPQEMQEMVDRASNAVSITVGLAVLGVVAGLMVKYGVFVLVGLEMGDVHDRLLKPALREARDAAAAKAAHDYYTQDASQVMDATMDCPPRSD